MVPARSNRGIHQESNRQSDLQGLKCATTLFVIVLIVPRVGSVAEQNHDAEFASAFFVRSKPELPPPHSIKDSTGNEGSADFIDRRQALTKT